MRGLSRLQLPGVRVPKPAAATAVMLALLIGGGGLIAGCSRAKAPLSPAPTLSGFVKAWARQDWRAMESFVLKPPSTFLSANAAAYADLHVEEASVVGRPWCTTRRR